MVEKTLSDLFLAQSKGYLLRGKEDISDPPQDGEGGQGVRTNPSRYDAPRRDPGPKSSVLSKCSK
jgi:hypothetical protein